MKFQAVIFDLDGTLLDTLADIAASMNTVLEKFGFPAHPVDAYRYFTGGGMETLVKLSLPENHRDKLTVGKCLAADKKEYRKRWRNNTKPYPGIPELLDELEKLRLPKAVLSNKPDEFTRIMVKTLLSRWSFSSVCGEQPETPRKPDPSAALRIARRLKIPPQNFLYLGDSSTDMQTADSAGMYAVGVLWGFRTADELLANGAKTLLKTPLDVLPLINAPH
jgi:phosphoglycolate phosphatase